MASLRLWLLTLATVVSASVVSYQWLDRPIALLFHVPLPHAEEVERLTRLPDPFAAIAVVTFVGLGLYNASGRQLSKFQYVALLCSLSLVMAEATKNQLKFVFGRTWPKTWVENNPSFLNDGVYGFNPFHGGAGFASFPSGHTAVTFAVISVLWMYYPNLRALYVFIILAVAAGLIGANYHFLSDVIAGAFVGGSTGWMANVLWKSRKHFAERQ